MKTYYCLRHDVKFGKKIVASYFTPSFHLPVCRDCHCDLFVGKFSENQLNALRRKMVVKPRVNRYVKSVADFALTGRAQIETYNFCLRYIAEHGESPSYKVISEMLWGEGKKTSGGSHTIVSRMVDHGFFEFRPDLGKGQFRPTSKRPVILPDIPAGAQISGLGPGDKTADYQKSAL